MSVISTTVPKGTIKTNNVNFTVNHIGCSVKKKAYTGVGGDDKWHGNEQSQNNY